MSRGGIQKEIVESAAVGLGDNDFETGIINIPAKGKIEKGTVLKRENGKFVPVTDTENEKPIAVNPFDILNMRAENADMSIRAIISGRVRADLLTVDGNATTGAQNDMLRDFGIIPIKTNDISHIE